MAYIGKQPTIGNFVKLDTITTSATATYNLLNGGIAYSPQSANHCIVSLNGVIQSPTTSFTISGSTIVFASALTSNDVIDFILVLGDVLNIGTPSDNTVSLAKLTATGTKDSTTFLRGDNTFQTIGANTPAWRVYNSSNQTGLSYNAFNTVSFNTVDFDTNSGFNTSTYKYVVPTTGKYYINFQFGVIGASSNLITIIGQIYNETTTNALISHQEITGADQSSSGNTYIGNISGIVNLTANDSLYGRVYCFGSSGTLTINSGTAVSFFGGYRLIGA